MLFRPFNSFCHKHRKQIIGGSILMLIIISLHREVKTLSWTPLSSLLKWLMAITVKVININIFWRNIDFSRIAACIIFIQFKFSVLSWSRILRRDQDNRYSNGISSPHVCTLCSVQCQIESFKRLEPISSCWFYYYCILTASILSCTSSTDRSNRTKIILQYVIDLNLCNQCNRFSCLFIRHAEHVLCRIQEISIEFRFSKL